MGKDKEKDKKEDPEKLEDFNIEINEFGEIVTNTPVEKLNKFLNKNLEDKKLKNNKLSEEQ
jgi:hypothetical protein